MLLYALVKLARAYYMITDQYFLILKELNLFPELSTDTTIMIEQVMNGVLLYSQQNLQEALNRVVTLEVTCKSIINQDYQSVISAISPLIQTFGISIVDSQVGHSYIIGSVTKLTMLQKDLCYNH